MRVLCFSIPEKGHLNPLLPTLRRVAEAGHELVFAATRDVGPIARTAGIKLRSELLDVPPPPAGFLTSGKLFAEKLRDADWLAGWIEALLIDAVPMQLPAVARLLARERPDVVIADPMLYAVAIACAERALPWAALSSSLNPVTPASWATALTNTLDRLSDKRAALFRTRSVPVPRFFVSDAESPWLNLAFTCADYCPHPIDPAIQLVGAPFDASDVTRRGDEVAFPWQRLGTKPRLYCSFGSQAFYQPRLFQRVCAEAEQLGYQVIASVGELIEDPSFVASAPPDAVLVRYAPQLELLSKVDLMVSHGGANSVVEALAHGRPLLLLTLCNDQPLQARFLCASGAGLALDASGGDVNEGALRAALTQLGSGDFRARAEQLGCALQSAGGPTRAAELVLQLGRTQTPFHAKEARKQVP
jgi:zeaxanthin glucosyltransferase